MGELGRRARMLSAGFALTVGLCLPAFAQAGAQTRCDETYDHEDLYDNVRHSLEEGDCGCARTFFTEFGRQNSEHIEANLAFFDEANRSIFFCEIEAHSAKIADDSDGTSSRVRGLGK